MPEDERDELHAGRFSQIPTVALDDPRITPTLLRLLCVLGTYGDKYGYCWPKLTTIARRMGGVSKSAISQGLKKLHDFGYLEITPRYAQDGARTSNMYRVLFDLPLPTSPELNPRQLPDLNRGLAPELNGGLDLELNTLNDPSEQPKETLPTAAAYILSPREEVNASEPAAAAAEWNDTLLMQRAERLRRRLHMNHDKLEGLRLVLQLYTPDQWPWIENEANLCFETLKVRPVGLNHFSNWLQKAKARLEADREAHRHEQVAETPIAAPNTAKQSLRERVAEARALAASFGLGVPESRDDER